MDLTNYTVHIINCCSCNEMTPEIVQQLNRENEEWMAQNKKRCMERCSQYKEQIMMKAWHPSRVALLYKMGYDVEDM